MNKIIPLLQMIHDSAWAENFNILAIMTNVTTNPVAGQSLACAG